MHSPNICHRYENASRTTKCLYVDPPTTQCPARVGFGQSRSERWRKNAIHSFREVQVKKKWLEIEIEKWKWNENDWKSRSRSESEMKKLRDRDREVKFLENFREFKKDRFWSIGKGAFGGYIISLCNLLDQREGGGGRCLRLGWNGGGWGQRSWRNGAWGILWRSRGRAQWWGGGGRLIPDFFDNKVNSFEDLFYSLGL